MYRAQYWLHVVVFALGFTVPWDYFVDLDHGQTTWLALAAFLARSGALSFSGATIAVLLAGIAFATLGAALRTWVRGSASALLFAGMMVHALALAMIMPPSGAVFAIVATAMAHFVVRFGAPVTRPHAGGKLRWPQAFLAEIYMWGVAGSYAIAGWRYNAFLLTKCVVVAFGVSLVVRAATMKSPAGEAAG